MTGRWKTMASRLPFVSASPPQVTRPAVGAMSPIAMRINVLLPDPFGPISTVGAPELKPIEAWSRIVTWPVLTLTSCRTIGRSLAAGPIILPCTDFPDAANAPGHRVDEDDDADQ